ncbi:Hypothetical predicted protein [Pelobates cultripes]|uniref:Uncharacterized protein n=1 Tax=Pelobates cultripes TaxID=61616 RepID=A0AAD1R7Y0_PELCU|nr:Hypothetical predicted protein [Pelobates cultripes]
MEELDMIVRRPRADIPAKWTEGSPVMEGALKVLLDDLRCNVAADINSFKEEISGVSRCLHDTEVTASAHHAHITSIEPEIGAIAKAKTQNLKAAMVEVEEHKNRGHT